MTTAAVAGIVLGLLAGLAPGPYTTMVAATGLERGFRAAVPLACAPLVTDVVPLLATAFVLTTLPPIAVTVMGIVGGSVLALLGLRLIMRHGRGPDPRDAQGSRSPTIRLRHVVTSTLLSPAPWLFWLGVGSPLLVRFWRNDWREGTAFVVFLFTTNIGSASGLAWVASHGRRVLAPFWRQRLLRLMGFGLILAGAFLVWQGVSGAPMTLEPDVIQDIVTGQDSLR